MKKTLHIVVCESGCQWLVKATSPADALAAWPRDAEPARTARPLAGDRAKAAYLRRQGQADVGA